MKTTICLSIDKDLIDAITVVCRDEDVSRSWLVAKVMRGWLARISAAEPVEVETAADAVAATSADRRSERRCEVPA